MRCCVPVVLRRFRRGLTIVAAAWLTLSFATDPAVAEDEAMVVAIFNNYLAIESHPVHREWQQEHDDLVSRARDAQQRQEHEKAAELWQRVEQNQQQVQAQVAADIQKTADVQPELERKHEKLAELHQHIADAPDPVTVEELEQDVQEVHEQMHPLHLEAGKEIEAAAKPVAREQGLEVIVHDVVHADEDVQLKDVTGQVIAALD